MTKTEALHIVSLSGGKDSTAMLLMLLERGLQVDKVVFVDLGKEFPEIYDTIDQLEKTTGIPVVRLPVDFDFWMLDHKHNTRKGELRVGYGWPQHTARWCTRLKRDAFKAYIRAFNQPVILFIGLAADETARTLKKSPYPRNVSVRYPLHEWGITEADALRYCYDHGFDFGGLYKKMTRASCYLCPFSRIGELRVLRHDYPDLWAEIGRLDEHAPNRYRADYSFSALARKFAIEDNQGDLYDKN